MERLTDVERVRSAHEQPFEQGAARLGSAGGARILQDSPRSWYVLAILTISYSLSYIDRQVLNLLIDPIKRSLLLTDTELSLIQGVAFISAYLLASPFFGRLVDTMNRRNILIFGVCTWSIFTALCGRADTFVELFLARFGVGLAEACALPVGWSMISDYFSVKRTTRAFSIYSLGSLIGGGLSLVAGGAVIASTDTLRRQFVALAELANWQLTFVLVGLPGLLFALVLLTVKEPERRASLKSTVDDRSFTKSEAARYLWTRRGFFGNIYLGNGLLAIVALGLPAWFPSFLIRHHGVPPAMVGFKFGLLVVTVGSLGVLSAPWIARLFERAGHKDATVRASAFCTLGMMAACAAVPLVPTPEMALVAAAVAVFCWSVPTCNLAVSVQLVSPSRMRGVTASLYTFFAQIIGFGIGQTLIAMVTDRVFGNPSLVGNSLGIVGFSASVGSAILLFSSLRYYRWMLEEESRS